MKKVAATLAFASCIIAACGNSDPEPTVAASPPIETPDRPPPQSIADLKSKVGPNVELSATRQGEPGRYDRLGAGRFNDLNSLSRWAALWVASSVKCDQLVDMDTRQSSTEELAWVGRCSNGRRYWVFENDVAAVKSKIAGRADADSISDLMSPSPVEGSPLTMMELLAACQREFNAFLPDGPSSIGDGYTGGKRRAGVANFRVTGRLSANAFSNTKTFYTCTVTDKAKVEELRYDIGNGVQTVRPST